MSKSVTFLYTDGVSHTVAVGAGETILAAGQSQGAPLLSQCLSGSCGTCLARLASGEAVMRADVASSLLKSEYAEGFRLTCIAEAKTDCVFELGYSSSMGKNAPRRCNAFVDGIDWLASDVVRLKLELAEGDWLDFSPGQFVQVKVPGAEDWRSYSMASTPEQLPSIELLIRVLPQGAMSDYLRHRARPDDVVELEGPFGSFYLRPGIKGQHVMIAGGTGLAPMMAMIDALRASGGKKPPMLLSFGCAAADSLFHLDELERRAHWLPGLKVKLNIDKGEPRPGLRVGNPVAAIAAADIPAPAEAVAYLCGPPGMVAAAHDHLVSLGLPPEHIFAEQFVASA